MSVWASYVDFDHSVKVLFEFSIVLLLVFPPISNERFVGTHFKIMEIDFLPRFIFHFKYLASKK